MHAKVGVQFRTAESARRGQELTQALAKYLEEMKYPNKMFTFNLHLVACR